MVRAVEKVRERLLRATAALEQAGIPYAVIGGNAVATWIARIDEEAVRNTRDVDLLVRREDFERAKEALLAAGFVYHEVLDVRAFVDGPEGSIRQGIHVLFAGEKVLQDYVLPTPDVSESEPGGPFRVLNLEALVLMKLTSFCRKDQVHIQDLIGVGLVDASWLSRVPPELRGRLQELLDDPNG
jgi:hypothetical protein